MENSKEDRKNKVRINKIKIYEEKLKLVPKNKNYSNFKLFYDDSGKLKVSFYCHEKYHSGKEHGTQVQNASYFFKKMTCGKCASHPSRSYDTEEWICMAKKKFPEFDYNKTVYINKNTKIIVTCKKHGEFTILPKDLMSGKLYCPLCTKERLHNEFVERVIKKAKSVHNEEGYIYHPELIYNSREKMGIECKKHGIFWQNISNHINLKTKCPMCVKETIGESKRISFDKIIKRANTVHNNKYIYHKETYTNTMNKTLITCPIHGDFEQTMHAHLAGQGCPKCGMIKSGVSGRTTQDDFIKKIMHIHRNSGYDFSKTEYTKCNEKVIVICPKHGEFQIRAMDLQQGQGCPICKMPKLEKTVRNVLIENGIKYKKQKRFKEILGRQSLDFYLPEYNIAIECQGLQHFKNERRYKELDVVIERDEKKKKICKNNNIHLIYYVPSIFSKYMKDDDIYFTDVEDLIKYIKEYKDKYKKEHLPLILERIKQASNKVLDGGVNDIVFSEEGDVE